MVSEPTAQQWKRRALPINGTFVQLVGDHWGPSALGTLCGCGTLLLIGAARRRAARICSFAWRCDSALVTPCRMGRARRE